MHRKPSAISGLPSVFSVLMPRFESRTRIIARNGTPLALYADAVGPEIGGIMNLYQKLTRAVTAAAVALTLGACAGAGGTLGDVLGGVLNAPVGGNQVSATVSGVDTRSQQIFLRQNDGTTVGVTYDNRTQGVYQNQTYAVTALENGDQVTARLTNNGNGNYYTDYFHVNQSVCSNTNTIGGYNTG